MDKATLREAMRIMGSKGGKRAAVTRAATTTPEERAASASVASRARSAESRRAGGRKGWASRTPAEVERATRKRLATLRKRRRALAKSRTSKDLSSRPPTARPRA